MSEGTIEQVLSGAATWCVEHGDCLEVLRRLPDGSVDSAVTDPPSGISFMGAEWDHDQGGMDEWVNWLEDRTAELLRVLKPGGYALVWSLPRTSHWTALALERAGFWVIDTIDHVFGTGFPKSVNASKAIDNHDFRQWLHQHPEELALHRKTEARCKELKQSKGRWWNNGRDSRATYARRLRKRVDGMQRRRAGLVRQVVKSYTASGNAGTPIDQKGGTYVTGAPNSAPVELTKTVGATERSQEWDGYGTGLKPAKEVWWLVQKPFKGTIAENLLERKTGAMNLDACRVPTDWKERPDSWHKSGNSAKPDADKIAAPPGEGINCHPDGREPANLVLSHNHDCRDGWCTDGCPVRVMGEQSGSVRGGEHPANRSGIGFNGSGSGTIGQREIFEGGSAARYFYQFRPEPPFYYCAKPSTAERDAGLEGFKVLSGGEATKRIDGDAGVDNPRAGAGRSGGRKNMHPTVKSWKLIAYLMRLITRPGGLCIDLFAGSGSGGIAAVRERIRFIGVELNDTEKEPFVRLARARIRHAEKAPEVRQQLLFDLGGAP